MFTLVVKLPSTMSSFIKHISRSYTLQCGLNVVVEDSRVNCYGDDTKIYAKNYDIWRDLPRGLSKIIVSSVSDRKEWVLAGMHKFEYEPMQMGRLSGDIESEIYMTKENGECCHVSGFWFSSNFVWVLGSKNVHIAVTNVDDLNSEIFKEERYGYCLKVARLFFHVLSELGDASQLMNFLNDGHTLCGEACFSDSQHIVDYQGENKIIFFSATRGTSIENGLTAMPPDETLRLFKTWGLNIPWYREVNTGDLLGRIQLRDEVYNRENSEGSVVYAMNAKRQAIFIYKFKNIHYIVERAVREVIRRRGGNRSIECRFDGLKRDFSIDVSPVTRLYYKQFNAFLHSFDENQWSDVFTQWVVHKREFNSLSADEREVRRIRYEQDQPSQVQLIMVGLIGSGKSTLGQMMTEMHGGIYVNQDELGGKLKTFQTEVHRATAENRLVVLDKCHHTDIVRDSTISNIKNVSDRLYFVEMMHPDDTDFPIKGAEISAERIYCRGLHHSTLIPTGALPKIISGFVSSWVPITDRSNVIRLDMTKDPISLANELNSILGLKPTISAEISYDVVTARESARINKKNKVLFWALDVGQLGQKIDWLESHHDYVSLDRNHVTLAYRTDAEFELMDSKYTVGQIVKIQVNALAFDDKAVALVLKRDFFVHNESPHITLALKDGVKPVYSNTMLQNEHNEMPMEMEIFGRVIKVYE